MFSNLVTVHTVVKYCVYIYEQTREVKSVHICKPVEGEGGGRQVSLEITLPATGRHMFTHHHHPPKKTKRQKRDLCNNCVKNKCKIKGEVNDLYS